MSYRTTAPVDPSAYMATSAYSSYPYPVDPQAATYYQQQQQQPMPMNNNNNGSVSPDGQSYSPTYPTSLSATGPIRHSSRRSPPVTVGMDEPTRPRRYAIPSSTSRKEVPTYFSRRVPNPPSIPSDEEDELTEEPPAPNATDQEKIEYKRRQNTLAARRSRKRKSQYTQNLQEMVERLTIEREVWKTRAITLKQLLQSHGVNCPEFPE